MTMFKSKLYAATGFIALQLLVTQAALAAILDFDSVNNTTGSTIQSGSGYNEDGFSFIVGPGESIFHWDRNDPSNADPDGATYGTWYGGNSLLFAPGSLFDLTSFEIGNAWNLASGVTQTFFFEGIAPVGVQKYYLEYTSDDLPGMETVTLNWTGLSDFRFGLVSTSSPGNVFYQADNFVVNTVPIPAAAGLFGSALLALGTLKRRRA